MPIAPHAVTPGTSRGQIKRRRSATIGLTLAADAECTGKINGDVRFACNRSWCQSDTRHEIIPRAVRPSLSSVSLI
jgi:hypothetical protein